MPESYFRDLKVGDVVEAYRMRGGNVILEASKELMAYKMATVRGRVVMRFSTHVVCDVGGRHGTPLCVDDANFARKVTKK